MANKFIGSGIIFPIELNENGRPDYVSDNRLIESSIKQILSWPKYIRFFNENFGSRLEELIEEPNDSIAKALLKTFIKQALASEKRITVINSEVFDYSDNVVSIKITYSIRNSKIEETYIYPYYKQIA